MIILDAFQNRKADQYTIENEPIKSIDLMERASLQCFKWLINQFDKKTVFHVICGIGNNGGDGLVISRLLIEAGYYCKTTILNFSDKSSEEFKTNKLRLTKMDASITELIEKKDLILNEKEIVIDAIFGSGLSQSIDGWLGKQIEIINTSNNTSVSIDMPSGLFMVDNFENKGAIVKSTFTLTFETPKLSFLLPEYGVFSGNWEVLDIGLNKEFISKQKSKFHYLTQLDFDPILKSREKFDHKGNYGHALIFAGSKGKIGAAILASQACLHTGVGLLTSYIPECGYTSFQTEVKEAMCLTSESENEISGFPNIEKYSAFAFGPGIGKSNSAAQTLKLLIQESNRPLVIDADGLNILSENKTWLNYLPADSILTPHLGEFKRLVGEFRSDLERIDALSVFAVKYKIIVLLKGAHTAIAVPDGMVFFNSTGNPGMATAGSGDVLTGMITAFLAQGHHPIHAACMAVFYHGVAGDIAAANKSEQSMVAGDIVEGLSEAF